eukprot:5255141-Alexandrium_andersonii.AAC.1
MLMPDPTTGPQCFQSLDVSMHVNRHGTDESEHRNPTLAIRGSNGLHSIRKVRRWYKDASTQA